MVEFTQDDDKLVCSFSGRMDTATSMKLEDEVFEKAQKAHKPTTFDLQNVNFVSSAFFRLCLKTARATPDKTLKVINAAPFVKDGFRITKLDSILNIE